MVTQEDNILTSLYNHYYLSDQTPSHLVSSHWREIHQSTNVEVSNGRIENLNLLLGDHQSLRFHHKILNWMTIWSYLIRLGNRNAAIRVMNKAIPLAKRMGLTFTYDCFRQACTVTLLTRHIPMNKKMRVINIGDGYGFLSSLIKEVFPHTQLCLVDLGKTLFFQSYYCQKAFARKKHFLVSKDLAGSDIDADADFIYCPAEHLSSLAILSFELAINVVSMQEMNAATIGHYFAFLRAHMKEENLFYCCNRLEKCMPGGEITRFFSYPWDERDRHLIDALCPWQRYYFSFHKTRYGPKVFKWRIPFIAYFDGDIRHRLSILHVLRDHG